jgi:SAM-dependent methyltransferase
VSDIVSVADFACDVLTGESHVPSRHTVPHYLSAHYWWAYVHPHAVQVFERQWLVNLILWGNYPRLRDAALEELGEALPGATLQVACVYGDLTERLCARAEARQGRVDIVDVLPIQLANLRNKLPRGAPARLLTMHSADLKLAAASYDRTLVFFLLHEQPRQVRERTLAEVVRVVKPAARSRSSTTPGRAGGIRCATSGVRCSRCSSRSRSICGKTRLPPGSPSHAGAACASARTSVGFISSW